MAVRADASTILFFALGCGNPAPEAETPAPESAAEAPEESEPAPRAESGPGGVLRLRFDDSPNIRLPITIGHPGGRVVAREEVAEITLPPGAGELTPISVGDDRVWVAIRQGEVTRLYEHPCCRIGYHGNAYDDAIAKCGDPCPGGTRRVPHALAADPVCGEEPRCVPPPQVRVVHEEGAAPTELVLEDGTAYTSSPIDEAEYQEAQVNIAEMFVLESGARVAMDHATSYTIWAGDGRIQRVHEDGRLP